MLMHISKSKLRKGKGNKQSRFNICSTRK